MSERSSFSSCEIPPTDIRRRVLRNRNYSFSGDFRWRGIRKIRYKRSGTDWCGISRQEIIGSSGESSKFHLRYFEIEPGGFSSFERHDHEHVVICVRGSGMVRLGKRRVQMKYLDILYIKGNTPHMLYNTGSEPFGFFCIVDAKRDRPRSVRKKKVCLIKTDGG
jgi:ribulose-bisphosphate carboxylase large chain